MSICYAEKLSVSISKPLLRVLPRLLLVAVMVILPACRNPIDMSALNSLAKSDIDRIADTSQREMNRLMEDLLEKLYICNPGELDKIRGMSIGQRQNQIFDTYGRLVFAELNNRQGTAALDMAFSEDYQGDRVFAIMTGLVGMVRSTYKWQNEQYLFDSLDEQELFKSARNIEVLATRLSNSRDPSGKLLLHSDTQPTEEENEGFERIFGKMIAIQDMMAFAIAGKWERGVNSVIKRAVFLPMGL